MSENPARNTAPAAALLVGVVTLCTLFVLPTLATSATPCPYTCYGNTYCSTSLGGCASKYFVSIEPKKEVIHLGGAGATLLVQVDDPIGQDGFYDVKFTEDSSGRFFAHFENGAAQTQVFVPKDGYALIPVYFVPGAIGSYELKLEAAHSIHSQPQMSGGVGNILGYESTASIVVLEEDDDGETRALEERLASAARPALIIGFVIAILSGGTVFLLFRKEKGNSSGGGRG